MTNEEGVLPDTSVEVGVENGRPGLPTKRLRVATWNMDHWKRTVQQRQDAWSYLESATDVALLQECSVPSSISKGRFAFREIGGSRPWGSAVVSFNNEIDVDEIGTVRTRYDTTRFSMLGTYPGTIMVALVTIPDVGPITCVSVYGMIDVYAQTTMLRIVADLIPLFDSSHGQRVILGGDFNLSTSVPPSTPELPRYRAILQAVEALGLENVALTAEEQAAPFDGCPCGQVPCHHLHTYGDSPGGQLDWLYATPELSRRCRLIRVDRERSTQLSDHAAILAEFDIPLRVSGVEWEPDTFAQELGRRQGEATQNIVEETVAWALRRHEMLRRERSDASLDRLPISDSPDPEMWIQLDMRWPDRLQYTFSINAKGRITIQFQYMSAPFDTLEARDWLWTRLSQIPGVSLDKRLTGRPAFPVEALADREALSQFLSIYDEVIRRTLEAGSGADVPWFTAG
jgi:hypothetical protein